MRNFNSFLPIGKLGLQVLRGVGTTHVAISVAFVDPRTGVLTVKMPEKKMTRAQRRQAEKKAQLKSLSEDAQRALEKRQVIQNLN